MSETSRDRDTWAAGTKVNLSPVRLGVALAVVGAFVAGFAVARFIETEPVPAIAAPQEVNGVAAAPVDDDTFSLFVYVTGPAPYYESDPCYSDTATTTSWAVREPDTWDDGAILATAESVEPLGCDEVLVTFMVPRAPAYSVYEGSSGGGWGPFSFGYLDRSDWGLYLTAN